MAKNDQQEAFERLLSSCLTRAIDFVRFAETKNAALLTFASAWIIGSVNLLTSAKALPPAWDIAFIIAVPLFALSAIVCILSFLPKTALADFHQDPEQTKALLYFGDAATYSPSSFRDRIRERYFPPEDETATRNYLDDLSIQIAVNSRIAVRKLRFFNFAAGLILAAFGVLAVPALLPVLTFIFSSLVSSTGKGT